MVGYLRHYIVYGLLVIFAVVVVDCSQVDDTLVSSPVPASAPTLASTNTPAPTATTTPVAIEATPAPASAPSDAVERTLISGEFILPAAQSFGDSGFHEVLIVTQSLPQDIGSTEGLRLVLALRDADRPGQTCSQDHPLSGCATVDWSDSQGRPGVPPGGVFDNHLTLRLASAERSFFLSDTGALNDAPDDFKPG